MNAQITPQIQVFYETNILPLFSLPDGIISWQGDSELAMNSDVYYFSIEFKKYLLIREETTGSSGQLEGTAIAPHESIIPIYPKDSTYRDVYLDSSSSSSRKTGYFSLYEVRSLMTQK